MKFVNISELKSKTSEILQMAQQRDIIVISRSKPIAIIRHFDEDKLEDYVLMNHPSFLEQIEKSYQEIKEGKITNIDEYLLSLEEKSEAENGI